jgi:hypothetical protein
MKPAFKRRTPLLVALLSLIPLTGCAASHNGFDSVVSAVQHHYSVRAQQIPLMGLVSFCARITTSGGVKGMQIAEFDNFTPADGPRQLEQLISDNIGSQWQRFVTDREANGELSLIFARPDGRSMDMLIADYDHGELDIVRMDVNGDRLEHWMHDPTDNARNRGHRTQNAQ